MPLSWGNDWVLLYVNTLYLKGLWFYSGNKTFEKETQGELNASFAWIGNKYTS